MKQKEKVPFLMGGNNGVETVNEINVLMGSNSGVETVKERMF